MTNALLNVNEHKTDQRTQARPEQVENNAGGFVFEVSDKDRLERFLILGTDGGTYYVGEKELTTQNVNFVKGLIAKHERLVVDTLVEVSDQGRAFKNSPALFTLAAVLVYGKDKAYAREAVAKVARTSTHIFEFAQYIENLGGWGRAKRKAVAAWYEDKSADQLAYQVVKYRQRNGWTHRDLMRLSHPEGVDQNVGNFVLGKSESGGVDAPAILHGFQAVQSAGTIKEVLNVLETYKNLPWETVPTEFHKNPELWKALFYNGQLKGQALVRNITRLSRNGAFKDLQFTADYAARLVDKEMIEKSRLHPINYLNALVTHEDGQTQRGNESYSWYYGGVKNKDWETVGPIVDALNEGFHLAFKAVEPANKRTMLAIDVSGSMGSKANGLELSCAQVSAVIAMQVARTEPAHVIKGFTSGRGYASRGGAELTDLGISAKMGLNAAMQKVSDRNFGGTDCAQPMLWAGQNDVEIDTFVVITDNETWAGKVQPFQALKQYRKDTGIDARLAVLGVASTDFTIADPSDKGMMDFVGFDSAAPRALADFSAGRI